MPLRTTAVDFDSDFTACSGELQQVRQTGMRTFIAGGCCQCGAQETLVRRAAMRLAVLNLAGLDIHLNPLTLHPEAPQARTFAASRAG
jgi:hypothetical protein